MPALVVLAYALLAYVALGLVFGVWFFFSGYVRIDSSASGAAWYTRLLWLPGAVLLWPLLLGRMLRSKTENAA